MCIGLSQSAQHDSDHADVQPSLGVGGLNFIMAHQAAMFHKPTEGPFDDPAFAQHFEATLVLQARHDLQPQGARLALRRHPPGQFLSAVALVGPQTAQPPEANERGSQQAAGALSFGHVGFGDTDGQEQPQRVHQDMTFDPFGFLGCIVASLARLVRRADGLRIENGGGGLAAFASLVSDHTPKHVVDMTFLLVTARCRVVILAKELRRGKCDGSVTPCDGICDGSNQA
jgi:hypothetical protein